MKSKLSTLIDEDAIDRFEARKPITTNVIDVLSKGNPKDILKLDEESRVMEREQQIIGSEMPDITMEQLIGTNDLMPIIYLQKGVNAAKSIAKIELMDDAGRSKGSGTGFMISPSVIMTNNHVLRNKDDCINAIVYFKYERDLQNNIKPVSFMLDPNKLFYTNKKLDFTIVCVNTSSFDNNPLTDFGYLTLIKNSGKAVIGEYVSIVQHPNGEIKQVALRENRVIDVFDNYVHCTTDTRPGSSGSPVFNDQWDVVSLHHSAFPRRDSQKNILKKDGKIWTDDMPEDEIDWIGNESIRISTIINHLEGIISQIPDNQKPILQEILNTVK